MLTPGTHLGPYEVLSPLGAGGMGEVYRARDELLGRDVAVKLLSAELAAEPEQRRRFEQEVRAAAALATRASWRCTSWASAAAQDGGAEFDRRLSARVAQAKCTGPCASG